MTDEHPTIDFRDPPPKAVGAPGTWPKRLALLLDHPGRWAMMHVSASPAGAASTATRLRSGDRSIPPGKWEFRASGCEVFARYIGPE